MKLLIISIILGIVLCAIFLLPIKNESKSKTKTKTTTTTKLSRKTEENHEKPIHKAPNEFPFYDHSDYNRDTDHWKHLYPHETNNLLPTPPTKKIY